MMFSTEYKFDDKSMNRQITEALRYRSVIDDASARHDIQPSIIAGIGSRESRWGLALKPRGPDGTGDFGPRRFPAKYREGSMPPDRLGFGRGLMQIDYDYHEFARSGNWRDPQKNIYYAVRLLRDYANFLKRKTDLDGHDLLRAAIASYNAGPGRILKAIRKELDYDSFTTGGDYSKDVLNRTGFFQIHGWE